MAVDKVGKVLALFISQKESSQRDTQAKIVLDEKGILGDKFYDKDIKRSILITSTDSYKLALEEGIQMPQGSLGENILIDYNPYKLSSGTQLQIGEVILEISQNCTICNHLASVDKRLPKLLKHDRGIFAQVIRGGVIKNEDFITIKKALS